MLDPELQKPSHEKWLHWAQILIDRLTTAVHVYSHPPFEDIFLPEKQRQEKNARALNLLHRLHPLVDEAETPTDSLADVAHHDEQVIAGLAVLVQETLDHLPEISADMQKLLKSPWVDNCAGRVASEFFRGPMGNEDEGIGSGRPEQGRLPGMLQSLLEREKNGDSRQPRKALHRHGEGTKKGGKGDGTPIRQEDDSKRRWADRSNKGLRSARGVE